MNIKSAFWQYIVFVYAVMFLFATALLFFPTTIGDVSWNWGLEIVLLLTMYTIVSWKKIDPSEIGVRLFFGKPIDQVGAGPTFVPLFLVELRVLSNIVQQQELPADPEKVYRGTDKDTDGKEIPLGMFAPIRILFGKPESPTTNPYDQQMVVEVTPILTYKIVDAVKFIREIGTWERAMGPIGDAVVTALNAKLSSMTPAKALTQLVEINKELEAAIDALLKGWGIDLESIRLKPFGFSHELNDSVLEVPKAQREKEAAIIRAEGKKQTLTLEGEGAGAAEKAVLDGRTAGLKNMTTELDIDGRTVLAAETARGITSNPGQKTIIAGASGFKDLALVAESLGGSLTKTQGV